MILKMLLVVITANTTTAAFTTTIWNVTMCYFCDLQSKYFNNFKKNRFEKNHV